MLDFFTLTVSLTLAFSLQAILFLFMTFFIKAYKGMRFWAYGCFGLALNFIAIYFRTIGDYEYVTIFLSNFFTIVSMFAFYYGSKQLFALPYNIKFGIITTCLYMLIIAFFTFVIDHLNVRILLYSAVLASLLFLNGSILLRHHQPFFNFSAKIVASLFILVGLFFVIRFVFHLLYPANVNSFVSNEGIQTMTLLVCLSLGILWTESIILMFNQKLQGELSIKSEELEATNMEKDKFFTILAHDLRGPLTTIMGMVDLMADKKSDLDASVMQEMAEAMKKSIHSTNILMDNLLDWASLQRGLNEIQKVQTTYGELMESVMPLLVVQAEIKKIAIEDNIPAGTPLYADPKMIQSILRNLLANALKFTPVNGKVQLISSVNKDGSLVFSVKDNGIGMDVDIRNNLFQINPLSRRTGTEGEKSTGLGLMICKEFVEKHGGRIWVDSQPGQGSTFSFCLEPNEQID